MKKETIQRMASDETHIRHIALELTSNWLATHAERITETELANRETEEDEDIFDAFFDPIKAQIERIASDLQAQAKEKEKGCDMCTRQAEERS